MNLALESITTKIILSYIMGKLFLAVTEKRSLFPQLRAHKSTSYANYKIIDNHSM